MQGKLNPIELANQKAAEIIKANNQEATEKLNALSQKKAEELQQYKIWKDKWDRTQLQFAYFPYWLDVYVQALHPGLISPDPSALFSADKLRGLKIAHAWLVAQEIITKTSMLGKDTSGKDITDLTVFSKKISEMLESADQKFNAAQITYKNERKKSRIFPRIGIVAIILGGLTLAIGLPLVLVGFPAAIVLGLSLVLPIGLLGIVLGYGTFMVTVYDALDLVRPESTISKTEYNALKALIADIESVKNLSNAPSATTAPTVEAAPAPKEEPQVSQKTGAPAPSTPPPVPGAAQPPASTSSGQTTPNPQ